VARLPFLDVEDLPEEQRSLLDPPRNLFRVLVHSPEALRNFSRLGGYIRNRSTLDARLREMAILQVGYLTRNAYEFSHHIEIGRGFGVSDADIRAIAAETDGKPSDLGDLDRAVLRLAREMTSDLAGSHEAFDAVRARLSNEHLIDLLMTIAYYNLVVRLLSTLEVDLKPHYEPLLEEFPLGE
jgi:alkylhydroperoxidase family enzyme